MGFQSIQSTYEGKLYAPLYGLSSDEVATEAMLLTLNRFPTQPITLVQDYALTAPTGSNAFMYFAYPAELGYCMQLDVDSNFIGGWDGAQNNFYELWGPIIINITAPNGSIVPFYVYRTDHAELGYVRWQSMSSPDNPQP